MIKETEVGHPVKAQEDLPQKTSVIAATGSGIGKFKESVCDSKSV